MNHYTTPEQSEALEQTGRLIAAAQHAVWPQSKIAEGIVFAKSVDDLPSRIVSEAIERLPKVDRKTAQAPGEFRRFCVTLLGEQRREESQQASEQSGSAQRSMRFPAIEVAWRVALTRWSNRVCGGVPSTHEADLGDNPILDNSEIDLLVARAPVPDDTVESRRVAMGRLRSTFEDWYGDRLPPAEGRTTHPYDGCARCKDELRA